MTAKPVKDEIDNLIAVINRVTMSIQLNTHNLNHIEERLQMLKEKVDKASKVKK